MLRYDPLYEASSWQSPADPGTCWDRLYTTRFAFESPKLCIEDSIWTAWAWSLVRKTYLEQSPRERVHSCGDCKQLPDLLELLQPLMLGHMQVKSSCKQLHSSSKVTTKFSAPTDTSQVPILIMGARLKSDPRCLLTFGLSHS